MSARRVDRLAWLDAVASERGPPHPQVRHVLMALALFMRKDGSGAWPSQETLAQRTGLSVRTVRRCLSRADRDAWLQRAVDRRDHGQDWKLTRYAATIPDALAGDHLPARGPDRQSAPPAKGEDSVTSPPEKVRTATTEGAVREGSKVRSVCPPIPLKKSHPWNPPRKSGPKPAIPSDETNEPEQTIDQLDLDADAIRIAQQARPGADPLEILDKFQRWGRGRPAAGWQRSLKTFAVHERLTDDELRAEAACIRNRQPPRDPAETVSEFAARVADPPIDARVRAAIAQARTTLAGGAA